jgi:hypothetical protein
MVVRVRIKLGMFRACQGPVAAQHLLKLRRWLTPASAVALVAALWRLAYDLDWTGRFAISEGLFSHWQVWMALAVLLQVLDAMLGRFGHGGAATP